MDRCTGCCDITEILLKMALNTLQSINQSINFRELMMVSESIHSSLITNNCLNDGYVGKQSLALKEYCRVLVKETQENHG